MTKYPMTNEVRIPNEEPRGATNKNRPGVEVRFATSSGSLVVIWASLFLRHWVFRHSSFVIVSFVVSLNSLGPLLHSPCLRCPTDSFSVLVALWLFRCPRPPAEKRMTMPDPGLPPKFLANVLLRSNKAAGYNRGSSLRGSYWNEAVSGKMAIGKVAEP